jgi:hypothetical protein
MSAAEEKERHRLVPLTNSEIEGGFMSDKDRQKKDYTRKDKKNKAMRQSEKLRKQEASPRQQAKDESSFKGR